jgi:hypothetical protein
MRFIREGGSAVAVNDDRMTIFPEAGQVKDVAKLLLELADHPNQVMTTLDPAIGFKIPYWLYELFVQVWDERTGEEIIISGTVTVAASEPEVVEPQIASEPVKRKPGRPRKEVK